MHPPGNHDQQERRDDTTRVGLLAIAGAALNAKGLARNDGKSIMFDHAQIVYVVDDDRYAKKRPHENTRVQAKVK